MRVVIKKTAETLDANVSKLEDKLDVCSCQIEAMECAFEDARLQGKAFDAIRAHCKGLKVPALKAHYGAMGELQAACREDARKVEALPESDPGICDTERFEEQLESYKADVESLQGQISSLNDLANRFAFSGNAFDAELLSHLRENLYALVSVPEEMAKLCEDDLKKAREYETWSGGAYSGAEAAAGTLRSATVSLAAFAKGATPNVSLWAKDAEDSYKKAFQARVEIIKGKIIGEGPSGFDEAYLGELFGRDTLTPEEVRALGIVYLEAIEEKDKEERSNKLDRLISIGYCSHAEKIEGSAGLHRPPRYNVTYTMKPGFRYLLGKVMDDEDYKISYFEKTGGEAYVARRALDGIACGLLMNESFTRTYSHYRPGASDTFKVRLHEGEDELGAISFKGSDEDVVFAYRDSATNNSNDMTAHLVTKGFSKGEIEEMSVYAVKTAITKTFDTLLDAAPGIGTIRGAAKHFYNIGEDNRKVREIGKSIDMTKYMENHFIGHATIVYSKNRLVSVSRPTEREKLADKIATERMKKEGIPDTEQNRGKWLAGKPEKIQVLVPTEGGGEITVHRYVTVDNNGKNPKEDPVGTVTNKKIVEEIAGNQKKVKWVE